MISSPGELLYLPTGSLLWYAGGMTPRLTERERQAQQAARGEPVYLVDAATKAVYVLLPAAAFERLRPLLEPDDFALEESYPLQEAVARAAGWEGPAMDDYDEDGRSRRKA